MSDIYLAISETPTVVTLTSAVLNSAVASSVTVMNTVTVALDANSLSALENVTVTVGAAITGTVTVGNSVTIGSLPAISGTVTANAVGYNYQETSPALIPLKFDGGDNFYVPIGPSVDPYPLPISGTVDITALPAGTNRIGVVTIGGGTVTIGAGTSQIGSVTASISNFPASTVVSAYGLGTDGTWRGLEMQAGSNRLRVDAINSQGGSSFPISGSVTLGAGTAQIGSVTASISNTVVTFYPMQGTTVTNSNFTSTTASTSLVSAVTGREVLTVFNEGAGNLHISPGATATTISYQVRLSAGDYWECPAGQLSLAHSAVFATAGTARVCQVA